MRCIFYGALIAYVQRLFTQHWRRTAKGVRVKVVAATPMMGTAEFLPIHPRPSFRRPTLWRTYRSLLTPVHVRPAACRKLSSTGTVPAGSYPCGISVVGPGPVTFDGTYSLGATNASAPALLVDATVVVQSGPDGATFYNNTGTISLIPNPMDNVGTIELAAPNSGTYAGILFYQDASDTRSATFGLYNGGTTGPTHIFKAPCISQRLRSSSRVSLL